MWSLTKMMILAMFMLLPSLLMANYEIIGEKISNKQKTIVLTHRFTQIDELDEFVNEEIEDMSLAGYETFNVSLAVEPRPNTARPYFIVIIVYKVKD